VIIRYKAFKPPDSYAFALDAAHTLALALGFLGADTSAYRREGGSFRYLRIRALEIGFFYAGDKRRYVDIHRAAGDARHILTVQAPISFVYSYIGGETLFNLEKILVTYIRRLGRHGVFL
jgi:hypothetical protein